MRGILTLWDQDSHEISMIQHITGQIVIKTK